tara:strand:- start:246 stop:473 length:228 start_codon:yes stop_codon:yes gene_type:complete
MPRQLYTKYRQRMSFSNQQTIIKEMIKLMPEHNQLDTAGVEDNSPNPAVIIGIFIAIGSFVLLTSTLNSVFPIFS